jgi:pantothenate synthetase
MEVQARPHPGTVVGSCFLNTMGLRKNQELRSYPFPRTHELDLSDHLIIRIPDNPIS